METQVVREVDHDRHPVATVRRAGPLAVELVRQVGDRLEVRTVRFAPDGDPDWPGNDADGVGF